MKIHKWKSHNLWLLPILMVDKDSIDVTICIGWWRWHLEFIFPNKGNNSFRGYEVDKQRTEREYHTIVCRVCESDWNEVRFNRSWCRHQSR